MSSWIAFGQGSTPDDEGKYYTKRQHLNCLKCLKKQEYEDSLIDSQKLEIEKKDSIIVIHTNFIESTDQKMTDLNADYVECREDLMRERDKRQRRTAIGTTVGTAVGGFFGWLITSRISK